MRVLVTGASGFIGNYVVERLLQQNCSVLATSAHQQKATNASWFKLVTYIPFDFTFFDPLVNYFEFFSQPDIMIHLAWEGLPNYKSSFHEEINLPRHLALLTNLISNGLTDLTVAGTCFEYGMQEGCLSEDMLAMPNNPYGRAKDTLRKELDQLAIKHPFVYKWARLFYMYGKGQNSKSLISQLDYAIENGDQVFNMSGGEQIRDFLPVEKVAEFLVKIALQNKITGIINCCSGQPNTVRELVEEYLAFRHKRIALNLGYFPYPDYEPMSFWGNLSKFNKIMNS